MARGHLDNVAFFAVSCLISFLSYGSQILFLHIEPYALLPRQFIVFNILICFIWVTYLRACFTDPGWIPKTESMTSASSSSGGEGKHRWCRKCAAFKPPRAHHCKSCQRCIPKMDHHCPWTINCVSHRTFPHFFRFLSYAVISMAYFEYFLYIRTAVLWNNRYLPSYLGPSPAQLILLFILVVTNSMTLLALAILLARNVWCLCINTTTIEGWEIERHENLVRRARKLGGYLHGRDGIKVRIHKQEFPYDIGIYANVRQGMGSNPLLWLWPFARTPTNESGLEFETNGFEDSDVSWPPPDPDRMAKAPVHYSYPDNNRCEEATEEISDQEWLDRFRSRQQQDQRRHYVHNSHDTHVNQPHQGKIHPMAGNYDDQESPESEDAEQDGPAWRDLEGDRLDDFGVDENVDFYDEDDMPLAELLRRRKGHASH